MNLESHRERQHIPQSGAWSRRLSPELASRLARVSIDEGRHGYDAFGLHREGVARALSITAPVYDRWFRVASRGGERIPARGPVVLAANHSGTLPFDAAMLWADVIRNTEPPRVARPVEDSFVSRLPFLGTLFARAGAVGGSRANVEVVLRAGEVILVFPEGVPGLNKPFRDRYQLREWRVGHAELAIRHRAPVVPVAVIGAEEQMPQLALLRRFHLFGAPHLPIPLTPLPLPVRYHVHYGDPIALNERFGPDEADDPLAVRAAADVVRRAVEHLIAQGLRQRTGVFS